MRIVTQLCGNMTGGNMETWGEMTKAEKIALFSAYLDGEQLEAYSYHYENEKIVKGWINTSFGRFHDDVPVRVKEAS